MGQQQRSLHFSIVLIFTLIVSGCASSAKLRADYDQGADFSSYKTWNFIKGAGPDYAGYESLFTRYMIEAITLEMNKRDYVMSKNPDLLVNFNALLQEKTKVTTSPAGPPIQGYYGYRGAHYAGWGGYGYGTETHVSQYTVGTFNIDLVDARKKQLVWEAIGVGRITDRIRANVEQVVKEAVPKFFALYPFVAGSSTPRTAQ